MRIPLKIAGVIITFLAMLEPVYCQSEPAGEKALVPDKTVELPAADPITVDRLDSLLKKEEERRNDWGISISANFDGDEAGGERKFILNTSASVQKGQYPRQLRFSVASRAELDGDTLRDEVSALVLNYDYYMRPSLEVYAFVERFKDTYLGIDERFEIGFGGQYEYVKGLVDSREIDSINDAYDQHPNKDRFAARVDSARTSLAKKEARLSLSAAFSLFKELERASVPVPGMPDIKLPSEDRYRFVVRPCARLVIRELELMNLGYFKWGIFEPWKVDGRLDMRIDAVFSCGLTLCKDAGGKKEVDLEVQYEYRYDSLPPSTEVNSVVYRARDTHDIVRLAITVKI
ncbi:MAG: hypothetical protein JSU74_09430 [Candidatus Zixiibacteriota bacterium]|nr:MAG: hypothetical protein JSU74_09430 [candidate division Zixibacteria bacterium]